MLYSRLVSDEAEVIPAYYLEQYQKEGGCLDAWELPWRTYSPQFHSFQEMVVHGPQDKPEAVQEALGDSVKKYYAFYRLPCDEFSQTEPEEYAVQTWPWTPKPRVRQGEEYLERQYGREFTVHWSESVTDDYYDNNVWRVRAYTASPKDNPETQFFAFNTVEGERFGVPGFRNGLWDAYSLDIFGKAFETRAADTDQEYILNEAGKYQKRLQQTDP